MIIKIISGNYSNLTFENNKYYELELDIDEYLVIESSEIDFTVQPYHPPTHVKIDSGEYIGKSMIDGYPIFKIDMTSLMRNHKIEQIII